MLPYYKKSSRQTGLDCGNRDQKKSKIIKLAIPLLTDQKLSQIEEHKKTLFELSARSNSVNFI